MLVGHRFIIWQQRASLHTTALSCLDTIKKLEKSRNRLFKIAQTNKRNQTYERDKIDEQRAMAEFDLDQHHLADLPKQAHLLNKTTLYAVSDVYEKALKVHGSLSAINARRKPLLEMRHEMSDAEKARLRMRVEARSSGTQGADRVVGIAFALNACDMVCKFAAAYLTGSKSLFAEAIHSTMDTVNQLILFMGLSKLLLLKVSYLLLFRN
jgi:hypothetical protein